MGLKADLVLRLSAKAIVVHDGRLLVIRKRAETGDYFMLPGGGQEHGEVLPAVIRREVFEETGYRVEPADVVFVRDYVGANHEFASTSAHFHQVEVYFKANLVAPGEAAAIPPAPDTQQVGVEWFPLDRVESAPIYPLSLRREIASQSSRRIYVGDVN